MWLGLLAAEPLALSWRAPPECADRADALAQLQTLLPTLPAELPELRGDEALAAEALAVEVEIERHEGAYQAELRFTGPLGTDRRRIDSERCELVASGALLVIAVTIDPVLVAAELREDAPAQPAAAPERVPQPEPQPPDSPPDSPPEPSWSSELHVRSPSTPSPTERQLQQRKPRVHAGILGGGGYAPLQAGTGTLAVDLGLHGEGWRGSLRGIWSLPRTMEIPELGTMRSQTWALGARACGVPAFAAGRLELPACVGLEAGALTAAGIADTPNPRAATTPWLALSAGLGLRYVPVPRLAFALDVDMLVPLLRGGFTISDVLVQRYAPLGVRSMLGLELRLP